MVGISGFGDGEGPFAEGQLDGGQRDTTGFHMLSEAAVIVIVGLVAEGVEDAGDDVQRAHGESPLIDRRILPAAQGEGQADRCQLPAG
jgi:hypothetical protein